MKTRVDNGKIYFEDPEQNKRKFRQSRLDAIADKKAKGKLTLEDLDAKLDIILEVLADLIRR